MKRTYAFYVVLAVGEVTNDDCDGLYEAGCDDGTVVTREGVTYVAFDRDRAGPRGDGRPGVIILARHSLT